MNKRKSTKKNPQKQVVANFAIPYSFDFEDITDFVVSVFFAKKKKKKHKNPQKILCSLFVQHIKYVTRIVKDFCVGCTPIYLRWLKAAYTLSVPSFHVRVYRSSCVVDSYRSSSLISCEGISAKFAFRERFQVFPHCA
mgnify:CR=1 FL=1